MLGVHEHIYVFAENYLAINFSIMLKIVLAEVQKDKLPPLDLVLDLR